MSALKTRIILGAAMLLGFCGIVFLIIPLIPIKALVLWVFLPAGYVYLSFTI